MEHTGFPSDETLAAFLDGGLDPETRRRVIEHMTTCDECYSVVAAGEGGTSRDIEIGPRLKGARQLLGLQRRSIAIAASVAAIVLSLLVAKSNSFSNKTAVQQLAAAAPPTRRIEGRLTGFRYAPLERVMRGAGDPESELAYTHLQSVVNTLTSEGKRTATEDRERAIALSLLLLGKTSQSVSALEAILCSEAHERTVTAAIAKSTNASLLSDLCAAYCERAKTNPSSSQDILGAVEAADRALILSPKSPEILWNRAIAVERLSVTEETKAAWDAYLAVDERSPWAAEARKRRLAAVSTSESTLWLRALPSVETAIAHGESDAVEKSVLGHPEASQLAILDNIAEWAALRLAGDVQRSTAKLQVARGISRALVAGGGDRFGWDLVAGIRPSDLDLASWYNRYFNASKGMRVRGYSASANEIEALTPVLQRMLTPLALRARQDLAVCRFYEERYDNVLTLSSAVAAEAGERNYPSLAGRALSLYGLACGRTGRHYEAIAAFRKAVKSYERVKEVANAATARAFLAEREQAVGRPIEAWIDRFAALLQLDRVIRPEWRESMLVNTAVAARMDHYPGAAFDLFSAAIHTAERRNDPVSQHDGLVLRGQLRLDRDDLVGALHDLEVARGIRAKMTPEVKGRAETLAAGSEAIAISHQSPMEALLIIDSALKRCDSLRTRYAIPELRYVKATILAGNAASNERVFAEIRSGIAELESQVSGSTNSDRTDDVTEHLYRLAVSVLLRMGDVNGAVDYSDRYRRFALRQTAQPISGQGGGWHARVSVISYFFAADGLVAFVRRSATTKVFRVDATEDDLRSLLAQVWDPVATGALRTASIRRMSELLVYPLEEQVLPCELIAIVPDRILQRMPFAALMTRNGLALVEAAPVIRTVFMREYDDTHEAAASSKSALIVGNPTIDEGLFASLPALAGGASEAAAIATLYPGARLLLGDRATRGQFLEVAHSAGVIHVAAHAVPGGADPLNAALLLARDSGEKNSGAVYARDILALDLSGTDLVVLSGCETGSSELTYAAGSLADAFVAAGARHAIATLSPIDDEYSVQFMLRFHRRLARHEAVVAAFADTQRECLHMEASGGRLFAWAAFALTTNGG
jgi:CHAT domain-containing protein/tetratricopeptide (TPR) repeat protein